jgi:hypothetical protein
MRTCVAGRRHISQVTTSCAAASTAQREASSRSSAPSAPGTWMCVARRGRGRSTLWKLRGRLSISQRHAGLWPCMDTGGRPFMHGGIPSELGNTLGAGPLSLPAGCRLPVCSRRPCPALGTPRGRPRTTCPPERRPHPAMRPRPRPSRRRSRHRPIAGRGPKACHTRPRVRQTLRRCRRACRGVPGARRGGRRARSHRAARSGARPAARRGLQARPPGSGGVVCVEAGQV